MNSNFQNLPPELQERINNIVNQAAAQAAQPTQPAPVAAPEQPPAPIAQRQPSLMDHLLALRQEVAEMRAQLNAVGQVSEAVGNAVGELYQMFCQQTETATYSSTFQTQQPQVEDEGY